MWHAHAGFRFCLFFHKTYCYIFLMFYKYTIFRLMRCLHVNRNLMILYCLAKRCSNYLPLNMKVNYLLICVYLKCFYKLAIRKIFMSSLYFSWDIYRDPSSKLIFDTLLWGLYKYPMKNILRTAKFLPTWGLDQRHCPALWVT